MKTTGKFIVIALMAAFGAACNGTTNENEEAQDSTAAVVEETADAVEEAVTEEESVAEESEAVEDSAATEETPEEISE